MPFSVPPEEWEQATSYFNSNPDKLKFSKKNNPTSHSIVRLNVDDPINTKTIFAVANKSVDGIQPLGQGAFGRVKKVKNQDNIEFALKIEKGTNKLLLRGDQDPSLQVMRFFHFFKGQGLRILERAKKYLEGMITRKRYTLLELIEGEDLIEVMIRHQKSAFLTPLQQHLIALQASLCVLELHDNSFIHGDIKPENFKVTRLNENDINLRLLDLDFSLILASNKAFVKWATPRGSVGYTSPEIKSERKYSKASDVYALGVIFKHLKLKGLSFCMTLDDPEQRPSLPEIISLLIYEINNSFIPLDPEIQRVIDFALSKIKRHIQYYLTTYPTLESLFNFKFCDNGLTSYQRCLLGIRCCERVLALHKQNKIAVNITPLNFYINVEGKSVNAEMVSTISVKKIKKDTIFLTLQDCDDPQLPSEFKAPESKKLNQYSRASDVYSLGILLVKLGLDLPGRIFAIDPSERPSLNEVLSLLEEMLSQEKRKSLQSSASKVPPLELSSLSNSNKTVTSSESSYFTLENMQDLIDQLNSPCSTTSPNTVGSGHSTDLMAVEDLSFGFRDLALSPRENPSTAAAAAAAATPTSEVIPSQPSSSSAFRGLFRRRRKKK
jgi:serine/threonine protein kinase